MSYNGKFITFEGGEGCGKSTQCALLTGALQALGATVLQTREPGGTEGAERIRELLLKKEHSWDAETEALLMFAARCDHVEKKIKPALARGEIVLSDRYVDSSMAYQGFARGLGEIYIETLFTLTCADILPDLTILLDIKPEDGLARAKARSNKPDNFEGQSLAFHKQVREGFLELAKSESSRIITIDASDSITLIHSQVVEAVNRRFGLAANPYQTNKNAH